MKTFGVLILAVMLPVSVIGQSITYDDAQSLSRLSEISRNEISTLRLLAEAVDPMLLGFRNSGEIERAVIGTPIREYMIRLDRLREYKPAVTNPRSLLESTMRVTLPVLLDGAARSAITLELKDDNWTPVSYGGANYSDHMNSLRSELADRDRQSEGSYFEVRVPALNLVMLGTERANELYLAPLLNDARFDLRRGEMLPADTILERLLPAAREHNDLPT